jgi:CD63 antigen
VPDSCCINKTDDCGKGIYFQPQLIHPKGCENEITGLLKKYMIAVGAVAAAVALLEILGIIFAFCLAHSLRKDYRVV